MCQLTGGLTVQIEQSNTPLSGLPLSPSLACKPTYGRCPLGSLTVVHSYGRSLLVSSEAKEYMHLTLYNPKCTKLNTIGIMYSVLIMAYWYINFIKLKTVYNVQH